GSLEGERLRYEVNGGPERHEDVAREPDEQRRSDRPLTPCGNERSQQGQLEGDVSRDPEALPRDAAAGRLDDVGSFRQERVDHRELAESATQEDEGARGREGNQGRGTA